MGKPMFNSEILVNVMLLLLCYVYVLFIIFVSGKMSTSLKVSRRVSRKFLHVMIGNLPFIIPFFTIKMFPALVAAPFILVTFLASPYSPVKNVSRKLQDLADITEEGHQLGLVFYAISYTVLALLFASRPYLIAAGILPMAYGDAFASIIGEKYGRRKYRILANKSFEGSMAMFIASFFSFTISLTFFSILYSFSFLDKILASLAVAAVATIVEGVSPMGFDNLTVPVLCALTFLLLSGGN
jgi:dolichol kinase